MQVKNLCFQHSKKSELFFKNISFCLEEGKLHALHGKNGIGKTVLLHLLNNKRSSYAQIEGEVIGAEETLLVNQRFDYMIADQFSFRENLQFACMNRCPHMLYSLKQPEEYLDIIQKFSIDIKEPVSKLSGGQRQILALLMVLQQKRKILLLDEPTATLDEENARMVFEFLQVLVSQGMTILVVCHDQELVHRYVNGQHLYLKKESNGLRTLQVVN